LNRKEEKERTAMSNPKQIVALIALLNLTCAWAAEPSKPAGWDSANAVSLDPESPDSYRNFAPELQKTVARMPRLDPASGLHVKEVKPGLFYVTDGVYQSAFPLRGVVIVVL
jgi:hypothetical protein